jgi:protein-tyrosine phosphatase
VTPHLADAEDAAIYLGEAPSAARRLISKLWPGPVALMFDVPEARRNETARRLEIEPGLFFNPQGQIVLRCPDQPLTRAILRAAGQPVAVTRAGLPAGNTGRAPGRDAVPDQVSIVFDAGPTRFSRPSTVVHVKGNEWEIVREGIFDRRIIERMLRTTVLFICSGNTCRSPMAAALARKLIADHVGVSQSELPERGFEVVSAGAMAMPGMRATPQAVDAVEAMGAELSSHRSQPLTVELVNRADAIFTMSASHTEAVTSLVPSAASRTMTLNPEGDVEDPIGSDSEHYRILAGEIEEMLRRRLGETVLRDS